MQFGNIKRTQASEIFSFLFDFLTEPFVLEKFHSSKSKLIIIITIIIIIIIIIIIMTTIKNRFSSYTLQGTKIKLRPFNEKRVGSYRGFGYLNLFIDSLDLAKWMKCGIL